MNLTTRTPSHQPTTPPDCPTPRSAPGCEATPDPARSDPPGSHSGVSGWIAASQAHVDTPRFAPHHNLIAPSPWTRWRGREARVNQAGWWWGGEAHANQAGGWWGGEARVNQPTCLGLVAGALLLLLAGCSPLSVIEPPGARAAVSVPAVTVHRGAIQQVVAASGEVRAKGQIGVLPKVTGRVQVVTVDVGSAVKAGDVLIEMESEMPTLQLQQAQANVDAAEARLAQVQAGGKADDISVASLAVQQQELRLRQLQQGGRAEDINAAEDALAAAEARLAQLSGAGRPEAVTQAKAAVDAAEARLELLQKGATPDVRQAAQGAVEADEALLASARAALTAFATTSVADAQQVQSQIGSLQSQVLALQESLAATEATQANIGAANAADVQTAQTALDTATAQRDAARAALAQADKPTDVQLTAAKQAVFQAQASKDSAQATYTGLDQGVPPATSGTACSNNGVLRDETTCTAQKKAAETALAAAQRAEVVAQMQLELVNNGGAPATRAQLQAAVASAEAQIRSTQVRLAQVKGGAFTVQQAQVEAQRAQAQASLSVAGENLKAAQVRLDALKTGASGGSHDAQRQALGAQVTAAEQKLKADQARVDQLAAGPQDEEIRAAQAAVRQADAQLGLAQQPATEHDIAAQSALVDQARQQVAKARRPYTDFDLEQQELALQQAEVALHARQVPFTAQDVKVAKAAVDQARAQLALAEVNVRETKVVAPIDGTVLERFTSPGATVGPGTPLLTIAPPVVEVVATISESLLGQLGVGQVVTLRASAYPGTLLSGTVVTLTPTIDPRTRTASVRIDPKDTDHLLKPGMMVQVGVVTSANEGALVLPKTAVTGTLAPGGSGTVLAIDAGSRVHPVVVTLGVVSETSVEIATGLTEGQQVVTGSTAGLSDGDAVNVQPAPTGTGR